MKKIFILFVCCLSIVFGQDTSTGQIENVSPTSTKETLKKLRNTCENLQKQMELIHPVGSVIAWHNFGKSTVKPPEGWQLCDGSLITDARFIKKYGEGIHTPNLNGNPNPASQLNASQPTFLQGNKLSPQDGYGGKDTIKLSLQNLPSHKHEYTTLNHQHRFTTGNNNQSLNHSHGGVHSHGRHGADNGGDFRASTPGGGHNTGGASNGHGNHQHSGTTGNPNSHKNGETTSVGEGKVIDKRPRYFKVTYIIRIY